MQTAWKHAGSQVSYVSARLMKIVLQLAGRRFHVIAVYAPTFRASGLEKDMFYTQLRQLVQECRSKDELIILGDFNARVGIRREVEDGVFPADQFQDLVLGPFGNTELNDNDRLLLAFL